MLKKGSITVFATIFLPFLLLLYSALLKGIQLYCIREKIIMAGNCVMDSTLAIYERELFNRYGILAVDCSFATMESSPQKVEDFMLEIFEKNTNPKKGLFLCGSKDLYGISIKKLKLEEYHIITDNGGETLKLQVIRNQLQLDKIDRIAEILDQTSLYSNLRNNIYIKEEIQNISNSSNIVHDEKKAEWFTTGIETIIVDSENNKKSNFAKWILGTEAEISNRTVVEEVLIENRQINTGIGTFQIQKINISPIFGEIVFNEYLLSHFDNFCFKSVNTVEEKEDVLLYQMEYLLQGTNSDLKNLCRTCIELFEIREIANYIALKKDSNIQKKVEVVSFVLSLLLQNPELKSTFQELINIAISLTESALDIKELLSGGKIPLMKENGDWLFQLKENTMLNLLGSMLNQDLKRSNEKEEVSNKGWDYTDYLRCMLLYRNKESKIYRFMNLLEMNIRSFSSNKYFKLDNCMDLFHFQTDFESQKGFDFSYERKFSFE